ncbi:hypothetical protein [Streptomyces laurentii]|uniref:hypothetical protein n=1 Tax=Streptomyces laurentii TaxID=39478 RepID=UPI0033FC20F5
MFVPERFFDAGAGVVRPGGHASHYGGSFPLAEQLDAADHRPTSTGRKVGTVRRPRHADEGNAVEN